MKKLLLTTAIMSASNFLSVEQAHASSNSTLSKINYTLVYQSINISTKANNMYKGDSMSIADAMSRTELYTGYGSAKMVTSRYVRF